MKPNDKTVVAVIGLGYVGLPLALEFGKQLVTIGFDVSESKVEALNKFDSPIDDIKEADIKNSPFVNFTSNENDLSCADYLIIAVPTPVDNSNIPDLSAMKNASRIVARKMKKGATVVFESTVYPGATSEICIPMLEKISGLVWKKEFFVGYSPERINPGDKKHNVTNITKVVSGDTDKTLKNLSALYSKIVDAGIHEAETIEIAEAAKVIENTQRDLNIALMNELAVIFDRMNINTSKVLKAAETKWNFMNFRPGLVGGHCIGVDPYYLTYKAEQLGYLPEVVLAGRRINDGMAKFIAEKTVKLMIKCGIQVQGATVNILGLTFKENCDDVRNSKVPEIAKELQNYDIKVSYFDPYASFEETEKSYGIFLKSWDKLPVGDACIVAVGHDFFKEIDAKIIHSKLKKNSVLVDVKSIFDANIFEKNVTYWQL